MPTAAVRRPNPALNGFTKLLVARGHRPSRFMVRPGQDLDGDLANDIAKLLAIFHETDPEAGFETYLGVMHQRHVPKGSTRPRLREPRGACAM